MYVHIQRLHNRKKTIINPIEELIKIIVSTNKINVKNLCVRDVLECSA